MKIQIDKDALLKSISIVDSLIPSRSVSGILSNCLFNVSKDEIEMISTDNEIGIRTKIQAVADSKFSFTANGKRFIALLKEMPKGVIELIVSDNFLIDIKAKEANLKGKYNFIGSSSKDYPEIPLFDAENAVELAQSDLKDMIKKVVFAAATDTIKPVFNGIYFVPESQNKLTVVATDSRRLSVVSRELKNTIGFDSAIIPLKAMNEVNRLLGTEGNCMFSVGSNQCFFKIGNTELVSRLVDGQFPNYKQVIPKDQDIKGIVERSKLIDSLRRAMVFTREPANKIILHFEKDALTLEVKTPELGESVEELTIECNASEKITIGLNAVFLMDALREVDSNSLTFGITGQMNPITIMPDNDSGFISVIMPIKIKSSENE